MVGLRVRLGWDEWTDKAREPLNRSPVDPGKLSASWQPWSTLLKLFDKEC